MDDNIIEPEIDVSLNQMQLAVIMIALEDLETPNIDDETREAMNAVFEATNAGYDVDVLLNQNYKAYEKIRHAYENYHERVMDE
jgi:hypothetical protein